MSKELKLPVTLSSSPLKWFSMVALGVYFVGIGFLMVTSDHEAAFMGWFFVIMGLLGTGVGAIVLIRPMRLDITRHGFVDRSVFRVHRKSWSEVGSFRPYKPSRRGPRMVGYDIIGDHTGGQRLSVSMGLPAAGLSGTYGMPAQELADFMNRAQTQSRGAA